MIQKIGISNIDRGFITILYPGSAVSGEDTGIGSIGRIDHAQSNSNLHIPMHPHVNDEILSYFRSARGVHKDSEGHEENINPHRMMFMQAGKLIQHDETTIVEDEPFEGLQIFIRPSIKDLKPKVTFWNLDTLHSENKWRLVASGTPETTLQFSSETWIYDMKLLKDHTSQLPELAREGLTCLLYVFKGKATVNGNIALVKKESLLIKDEAITITANEDTELVLFVTDEKAEIFKGGMYSGNKL